MNCHEVQQRLSDFLDDGLPRPVQQAVGEHLRSCLLCRKELLALKSVVEAAHRLPSEIPPSRDLWPEVAARLPAADPLRGEQAGVGGTKQTWWLQLAAAVIALLVLSVPLSVWWMSERGGEADEGPSPRAAASPSPATDERMTARAVLARSQDGVLLAKTDLVIAIERRRDVIEDETLRILEHNMALLDQAIGELQSALEADPYNRRLRLLLASRYQQERRLLQTVSRV